MNKIRSGQSIMEVLIAIGIMVIGIAASSAMMIVTERSGQLMLSETQAAALAEEGIQAAISIRDRSWDELSLGTHGLVIQESPADWIFQGSSDSNEGFTRTVTVSEVDLNTKKVAAVVSWNSGGARMASVEAQILLTNWPFL